MDEYITKKDLLQVTGISYGQLYRWKRMNIIPENWFIKRSSFTGQETVFPRDKILERIQKIIELKDQYSLEELAKFFSPNPAEIELSEKVLIDHEIISEQTLRSYNATHPQLNIFSFETIYYLYICQEVAKTKLLTLEEGFQTFTFIKEYYRKHHHISQDLLAIQKNKEIIWMMVPIETPVVFENQAQVVQTYNLLDIMNELKVKLTGLY